MEVTIVGVTHPRIKGVMNAEELVAYAARVSNPNNQMNTLTAPKLLNYLMRHKHWSPFEMVHVVMEINTTRDIARQILRHRSFSFQEFSQRYADARELGFTLSETRLQDTTNRQNSLENQDAALNKEWIGVQNNLLDQIRATYSWALYSGIAKELARKILPEGLTNSRLYMSGTLRSWIHYCQERSKESTQKEHRILAKRAAELLEREFPAITGLLNDIQQN